MLRRGRLVLAMLLLGLSQQSRQRRDDEAADSSSGKPRLDFLEQPAVAVRIAERGKCAVGAAVGCGARHWWSAEAGEMECLTDAGAAADQLGPCRLDVRHDEIQILGRARRCRR